MKWLAHVVYSMTSKRHQQNEAIACCKELLRQIGLNPHGNSSASQVVPHCASTACRTTVGGTWWGIYEDWFEDTKEIRQR